jgi:hypothetical protein
MNLSTEARPWFVGDECLRVDKGTMRWLIVLLVGEHAGVAEVNHLGNALDIPVSMVPVEWLIRPNPRVVKATPGQRYVWRVRRHAMASHSEHAVGLKDGSLLNLATLTTNQFDPEVWVEEDSELPIEV